MALPPDHDQRRLPPTQKRIDDFRRQGKVPLSRDLVGTATFAAGAAAGLGTAGATAGALGDLARELFGQLDQLPIGSAGGLAGSTFLAAIGPTLSGALAGCFALTAAQLGYPPAIAKIHFDLARLCSPAQLVDLLSPKAGAGRMLKAVAKLTVVAGTGAWALETEWSRLLSAPALDAMALSGRMLAAASRVVFYSGLALAGLAAADYAFARRRIQAELRMTPEELKRELREQEGDPALKNRRRRRMRELAKRRTAAAVKSSDVVVVNPTEYAVALRYRTRRDKAPKVVAKGRGAAAEHIRELARKFGVPIVPNIPVARLLFKIAPEGKEIPAQVYKAVAEILAYVYRTRGGGPR